MKKFFFLYNISNKVYYCFARFLPLMWFCRIESIKSQSNHCVRHGFFFKSFCNWWQSVIFWQFCDYL